MNWPRSRRFKFLKSIGEKVDYMNGADYDVYRAKRMKQFADLIKEVGAK